MKCDVNVPRICRGSKGVGDVMFKYVSGLVTRESPRCGEDDARVGLCAVAWELTGGTSLTHARACGHVEVENHIAAASLVGYGGSSRDTRTHLVFFDNVTVGLRHPLRRVHRHRRHSVRHQQLRAWEVRVDAPDSIECRGL